MSNAERQAKFRAGKKTLTINVTEGEKAELQRLFAEQGYDANWGQFLKSALIQGAKFRANMGSHRKEKN